MNIYYSLLSLIAFSISVSTLPHPNHNDQPSLQAAGAPGHVVSSEVAPPFTEDCDDKIDTYLISHLKCASASVENPIDTELEEAQCICGKKELATQSFPTLITDSKNSKMNMTECGITSEKLTVYLEQTCEILTKIKIPEQIVPPAGATNTQHHV